MNVSDFDDRLTWSYGQGSEDETKILMGNIPGIVNVVRANENDDRNGTDYWARRMGISDDLSIDVKRRNEDPLVSYGADDLALESWSVIYSDGCGGFIYHKIGWTRDIEKRTDFVLWLFVPTGRWVLIPFPMLCAVYCEKWEEWRKKYKTKMQHTVPWDSKNEWYSECTFVPRKVIWRELYSKFGGQPIAC